MRHRTAGPAPPANSTPIVAVVVNGSKSWSPTPAFRCLRLGSRGCYSGGRGSRAPTIGVCGRHLVLEAEKLRRENSVLFGDVIVSSAKS